MRKQLCDALVQRSERPDMVFLTGDLGFMALEPLQTALGERFVNAGVAEQNMVTVAAAMAAQGLDVWTYSIAPFLYARPFEQIRNDVCFHNLPVRLIGNGGGYGYGVMGPTHHAIEDYGILLTLPHMSALVPAFDEDVEAVVALAGDMDGPTYVRIGRGEPPVGWTPPPFSPWRQLSEGGGPVLIVVGPLAGTYISAIESLPFHERPNMWLAGVMPIDRNPVPRDLISDLKAGRALCVAEEHVAQGSFGAQLLMHLAKESVAVERFAHLAASAHNFGRYGSQSYLRARSALDPSSLLAALGTL